MAGLRGKYRATNTSQAKVQHRLDSPAPDFPDFMFRLIEAYRSNKISFSQLNMNSKILMGAGSETTATLLSGKL